MKVTSVFYAVGQSDDICARARTRECWRERKVRESPARKLVPKGVSGEAQHSGVSAASVLGTAGSRLLGRSALVNLVTNDLSFNFSS